MMTAQKSIFLLLGLFFSCLIIFTWNLAQQEIVGFDSRFYLFALEMWHDGFSWFPTTYLKPYPDYPATAIWLIYLAAKAYGHLNKFIAVLPSAIAAALTVVITYCIGGLYNKRLGLTAVFFLLLTISFFKSARSIALDMYPTLITVCCFYLVASTDKLRLSSKRTLWIYPLLFLGFIFRGPIGLIMPTGVIAVYYLINHNLKKFLSFVLFAFLVLILSSMLLLMLAYHAGGSPFMHAVLKMQVFGRLKSSYHPFYFYFTDSFANYAFAYPIAFGVFVIFCYALWHKNILLPEKKFLFTLFAWAGVILIGMSIPGDKKVRYILAMTPAIALIAAYPFAMQIKNDLFHFLRKWTLAILLYLPAVFMLITEAVFFYAKNHRIDFAIDYVPLILFLIALQLSLFWFVYYYISQDNKRIPIVLFAATMSFIVTYIFVFEPVDLYIERAKSFVVAVENERSQQQALLVFYKLKPDGFPIKYIINMPHKTQPIFINNEKDLIVFSRKAFFITSNDYFDLLSDKVKSQLEIIASDVAAHHRIVVFTKAG